MYPLIYFLIGFIVAGLMFSSARDEHTEEGIGTTLSIVAVIVVTWPLWLVLIGMERWRP